MNRMSVHRWIVAACVLAAPAIGQDVEERPERATKVPTAGFWPTERMMERMIDRITEEMGKHYGFDEDQLYTTREMFKANYPKFLNENRAEVQTLMNEYFEALLNDGPPAVEEVAGWAQRVQPLLAEFGEVSTEVMAGMREYLTDEQLTMFDAESAAFETGMSMAQNKLSAWAAGGYDPETEWIHSPPPDAETQAEYEAEAARAAAENEGTDVEAAAAAVTVPKDDWTIYTEKFIERYQLNVEQKQKAFVFLRRQQEARDRFLRRKAPEMARVSKLLSNAETEEARTAALAEYEELNEPVARMFQTLKDRLATLPTRAQRKAAAELEPEGDEAHSPTSAESSPSDDTDERLEELGYVKPTKPPKAEDD